MSNRDPLPLYSASQLPRLFTLDASCKFIALKVNLEAQNTALHAIYIEKQQHVDDLTFCALVTVTEWDGKMDKEEFFIEAESMELLLEKLQRFDETNSFIFIQVASSVTIDTLAMSPQEMLCTLFPELGSFNKDLSEEMRLALKNSSLVLLGRLEVERGLGAS